MISRFANDGYLYETQWVKPVADRIALSLIENVSVSCDGTERPLVSSRKTRALLAYLALTGQTHRREHLCELFFDRTSDPRSALRWALSKLRLVLDDDSHTRLTGTRDTVKIDMSHVDLDTEFVRRTHADPNATTKQLRDAATLLAYKPLAGLEMSATEDFNLWLLGEREELQDLRGDIIQKLITASDFADHEALKWLRLWCRLEPYSHDAPRALWTKLNALQRQDEAQTVVNQYRDLMGPDAQDWNAADDPLPSPTTPAPPTTPKGSRQRQNIGFCKAPDGVNIAYATVGEGPPLVKAANWLNHLELDWGSPIWGDTFQELASNNTFIRYDERGNGLSDWDVPEISFPSFLRDLETIVDGLKLDRFPLLGMSQGCAVSIEYAVRHPERVSALILIGGYASGWRIGMSQEDQEQREAVLTLTRHGWGTSNPAYRHIFSQTFMPDADADRLAWFDDFQRQTTSPENAVRFQQAFGDIDVRHLLSQIKAPTLVLHARGDQRIPLDYGRELAAEIPNAKLVTLESRSHIILGDEPAWQVCMQEIQNFLNENR